MIVKRLIPNGYCYGVVLAVNKVAELIQSDCPKPIHIYGMLIHNTHVIEAFERHGVITHIDPKPMDIMNMTGTIVFSAHGIQKKVVQIAEQQGLHIVNTVCKDVQSTIDLIDQYVDYGYKVLYVGKAGHPEAVASTERDHVYLIETIKDLDQIDPKGHYAMTNQTTLSSLELFKLYEYAKERFPNLVIMEELCNATKQRQLAVIDNDSDVLVVVGDKKSNNSNALSSLHKHGILVEDYKDLFGQDFTGKSVALSAGASTPRAVIKQVIDYLTKQDGICLEVDLPALTDEEILALK